MSGIVHRIHYPKKDSQENVEKNPQSRKNGKRRRGHGLLALFLREKEDRK